MDPLDLVRLTPLMKHTRGGAEVRIGLIDGRVVTQHPDLVSKNIHEISGANHGAPARPHGAASQHATFIAGILSAKRGSFAPAICPGCTLLVRPIFDGTNAANNAMPSATPQELARAILDCMNAGASVLNLSAALAQPSINDEQALEEALDQAVRRGVIVVVAAGNQGLLGSTAITRHPSVIPVAGYDAQGVPMTHSNLGGSIGRRGLGASGDRITSIDVNGTSLTMSGTSAAAPFVTGAIALLRSEFPTATATEVKLAVTQAHFQRRSTVVPPLLDAWGAYQMMRR